MHEVYAATALTPLKVARSSGYIDWASQPSLFKHYPDFLYRLKSDAHPALLPVALARCITFETDVGGKPYYRLNTPSAGNLHPVELYVQIRGVKGVLSGIYHVDARRGELVLIRECGADGLEPSVGMPHRFEGFLFVVSVVPYRSEWKYGHRAWRYCYMDAGHQIGALCAALQAHGRETFVPEGADLPGLGRMLGFAGEESVCAVLASGRPGDKPAKPLKTPLMRVSPTDYNESDGVVPGWLAQSATGAPLQLPPAADAGEAVQRARRSARAFDGRAMETEAFEYILHMLRRMPEGMTAYTVVLRPDHAEPGLYRDGERLKSGAFAETVTALLVDQRFVANAEIVMILCAERYDADMQMEAAAFAHALSLGAAEHGAAYTAIGAFYDKKLQTFLETSAYILYVGVFGAEKR